MKKFLMGFMSLALAFTLVACGTSTNDDGAVTWNAASEPPELNSVMTSTTGSGDVLVHVMTGLTQLDANDKPVPGMAKSWDVSSDGLTYTFHLREDATWSNGEKVTANDFVFAYNLLFDPSTGAPYAGTWAPLIKGAQDVLDLQTKFPDSTVPQAEIDKALSNIGYKALDDYTFEMTLTGPYEFMLSVLAFYNFLPLNEKAFTEIGGLDKYGKDADKLVYNGAYEISSWKHESELVMKKRADYYDADNIKIDTIKFKMISDANAALNSFEAGELDVTNVTGQQAADLVAKGTDVKEFGDGSSWYLEFNTTKPGLDNAKIRKALTLAIDAQKYIDKVVLNKSNVANSFVPEAIVQGRFTKLVGDVMNRPADGKFDEVVKLFEEGLAEAGLTRDTFKPDMVTDDGTSAKKYGAYIKEQMNTVLGVDLQISEMTYKSRIERMQNHEFDIVFSGWGPDYNDPMTFLDIFTTGNGNNHTQWSNARYDELVKEARAETDQAKRDQIMVELEKILVEESPIGYIYNRSQSYVQSDKVTGVVRSAFSNISFKYAELK